MQFQSNTLYWFRSSQSLIVSLSACVLNREVVNTNVLVFCLIRGWTEVMVYCIRGWTEVMVYCIRGWTEVMVYCIRGWTEAMVYCIRGWTEAMVYCIRKPWSTAFEANMLTITHQYGLL
jgi:hypothetical protein